MVTTKARTDIYSNTAVACSSVVQCRFCNTFYHTVRDDLARAWLQAHLGVCKCVNDKERKQLIMATAGPLQDAAIDVESGGSGGTWKVRCAKCQALLAKGNHGTDDVTGQKVRESIASHVCGDDSGRRVGRITED